MNFIASMIVICTALAAAECMFAKADERWEEAEIYLFPEDETND